MEKIYCCECGGEINLREWYFVICAQTERELEDGTVEVKDMSANNIYFTHVKCVKSAFRS